MRPKCCLYRCRNLFEKPNQLGKAKKIAFEFNLNKLPKQSQLYEESFVNTLKWVSRLLDHQQQ